jgi:hypothetical protein
MVVSFFSHCARANVGSARNKSDSFRSVERPENKNALLEVLEGKETSVAQRNRSVDLAGDGDAGLAKDMGHLRLAQARGVVLERQVVLVVDAEAAQAVGVGEFAEMAELILSERGLQFVGDFDESHARIIAGRSSRSRRQESAPLDFHRGQGYI